MTPIYMEENFDDEHVMDLRNIQDEVSLGGIINMQSFHSEIFSIIL